VDIALWVAQVLLGIGFIAAGLNHAVNYDGASKRMDWMTAVGRDRMRAIGILEVLGGVGVILPAITGVAPWLTPVAATCLAVLMLAAIVFHLRRRENAAVVANLVLGLLAGFVAYGRFVIEPF
jgi:putative oxidoreductase